tara:strand:+ start:157 stop:354 length:198 start_codon:yes stop_codon:yes gene_type:complete
MIIILTGDSHASSAKENEEMNNENSERNIVNRLIFVIKTPNLDNIKTPSYNPNLYISRKLCIILF